MKFPRPSPSIFAYYKPSKTGGIEGLGTRLGRDERREEETHGEKYGLGQKLTVNDY